MTPSEEFQAYPPRREPVLAIREIQGNVLPGFFTPRQTLLFLRIRKPEAAKAWLRDIARRITTAQEVLSHRQEGRTDGADAPPWLNVAFSFGGLRALTPEADRLIDPAFKEGLHRRSILLGDPTDEAAAGHCTNWVIGGPDCVPDVLLIVAGRDRRSVSREVAQIEDGLGEGLQLLLKQTGADLPPPYAGCEHFGFRDNLSQPGVRGRLSEDSDELYTPRWNPDDPHQGLPGQNVLWPGEFVFGYPGQAPLDKHKPGLRVEAGPDWAENGSYLVFRRLRQDVGAFRDFLRDAASQVAEQVPSIAATPEWIAAKLVGRWRSGAPLLRAPHADDPDMADDACARNHFAYLRPSEPLDGGSPCASDGQYPASAGDPEGVTCPFAAHVRRAYPRDDPRSLGMTEAAIETHRILRRSIPYGAPFPNPGERGLLFLAYQTSIERQFEFINRGWLNNPNLQQGRYGHDPLVGQSSDGSGNRTRSFTLKCADGDGNAREVVLSLPTDWVTPTGGGYFFAPAVSALETLSR